MKVRKITVLLLTIFLIGALSACGNGESASQEPIPSPASTEQPSASDDVPKTDADNAENDSASGERIMIAYFAVAENSEVDAVSSASVRVVDGEAKGLIRILAETIRGNVGGDLFSIQTSVEYPGNIMELIDYADEEQSANERPPLTSQMDNLEDYDIIYVGYPNWWYDLPMVMYSFFEEYDFSGKTIVPFCTHNGSGFSGTIQTIRSLQPDADVLDGYTVSQNRLDDIEDAVPDWLREIGMIE